MRDKGLSQQAPLSGKGWGTPSCTGKCCNITFPLGLLPALTYDSWSFTLLFACPSEVSVHRTLWPRKYFYYSGSPFVYSLTCLCFLYILVILSIFFFCVGFADRLSLIALLHFYFCFLLCPDYLRFLLIDLKTYFLAFSVYVLNHSFMRSSSKSDVGYMLTVYRESCIVYCFALFLQASRECIGCCRSV